MKGILKKRKDKKKKKQKDSKWDKLDDIFDVSFLILEAIGLIIRGIWGLFRLIGRLLVEAIN